MQDAKNKVIFITGASSGFGLLLALAFAKAGHTVIATMRNLDKQVELLEKAEAATCADRIKCLPLDVTDPNQAEKTVAAVIGRFGQIDVLINNAGFAAGGFIEEVPMEAWYRQMETNVFGLIRVTKVVLPHMRQAGKGTIVNISSISGHLALPGLGPYSTSKFAIEGFSETLRLEMQPFGIRVLLFEPGAFKTSIWEKSLAAVPASDPSPYKEKMARLLKMVGHIVENAGNPNDVAGRIIDAVESETTVFRHPIGNGVKTSIRLKNWMPWRWIERNILKRL